MVSKELLESLDRDGYAVVRDVVPKAAIEELRRWAEELAEADLQWRLQEVRRRREAGEKDARAFPRGAEGRIGLAMDDDIRRAVLTESVTDMAEAMGTPLHGHGGILVVLPGFGGGDGVHQDLTGPAPDAGAWDGAILTWPLSTWEGMRLIPGSHRRDPVFREEYAGAIGPQPGEVYVDAGPGDVVINSMHIWKSQVLNRSTERRSEIWIGYKSDDSVSAKIAARWAEPDVLREADGIPAELGNYVKREYEPAARPDA